MPINTLPWQIQNDIKEIHELNPWQILIIITNTTSNSNKDFCVANFYFAWLAHMYKYF